jgi:hypothetical protein
VLEKATFLRKAESNGNYPAAFGGNNILMK